jgi:hypothetical protein
MDVGIARELVEELKALNANVVQLCLAVRSNSGNQSAPRSDWGAPGSPVPGIERRTALAMEQLRRYPDHRTNDQDAALRIPGPAEPRSKSETRAWGLEIGEADLVLDDHRREP